MLHWDQGTRQSRPVKREVVRTDVAEELRDAYRDIATLPALRQIERMSQIGFWRIDLKTENRFWSPEIFSVYGMPAGDILNLEEAMSCYHDGHREILVKALEAATKHGESYDLELDFTSLDGQQKRVRTLCDAEIVDGEVVALFGLMKDVSERYQLEVELRAAATTDPLTGLPNRRHLEMYFDDLKFEQPRKDPFILAIVDMDYFKTINDVHGHGVGDLALIEVARRLDSICQKDCFAARIGGDEFVLITSDTEVIDNIVERCDGLLKLLQEPVEWNGKEINISATIGAVEIQNGGVSISQALHCADAALYVAKAKGRGTATISTREALFMDDSELESLDRDKVA